MVSNGHGSHGLQESEFLSLPCCFNVMGNKQDMSQDI